MASAYITAAQVGSYFVTQYYQMLQQTPEVVHQLYSELSTMIRINGQSRDAGSGMMFTSDLLDQRVAVIDKNVQIHALVMSLRYSTIEIKTAHSLESWNGGVIVMVTGVVQMRDFSVRKKFAQTFFLAPQEKGYFVLNDIFHFIDEEQIHPYPVALMAQNNVNSKLTDSSSVPEPVPSYFMSGSVQAREYAASTEIKENGTADQYCVHEQSLQQVQEPEVLAQDTSLELANGYLEHAADAMLEAPPVEEAVEEPQKHTYASILRVAKAQSGSTTVPAPSSNRNAATASEWHKQQPDHQFGNHQVQQSGASSAPNESFAVETSDEVLATDDRGEIKSVYVRGLPSTLSASEVEEEFKNFGKVRPGGVAIRRVKDTEVCYAFVEFEDITGVQNAIEAATVEVSGQQLYIEERRANSSFARGRRGRGRGMHQPESSSRARLGGRSFGRGGSTGGRDQNRSRGSNGFYRQTNRGSRNGHYQTEIAA